MYYKYKQYPSGGHYCEPAQVLIVEANHWQQANARAERAGAYFDGLNCYGWCHDEFGFNDGTFCSCQIDWHRARWTEIFTNKVAFRQLPYLAGRRRDGVPYLWVVRKSIDNVEGARLAHERRAVA